MEETKFDIKIVTKEIGQLRAAEYNPRKISAKKLKELEDNIDEFGYIEAVIVNVNPDRFNVVVAGHQRLKVLKRMGRTVVDCIEVNCEYKQERRLNLKMNNVRGEWDTEIMQELFMLEELQDAGIEINKLKRLMPQFEDLSSNDPVYPIVPKMSEKYGYVIIFADNEIDLAYLHNYFDLQPEKSYKTRSRPAWARGLKLMKAHLSQLEVCQNLEQ